MASPDDKLAEIASPEPNYASPANNNSNNNNNRNNSIIIIIIIIIITFILIQEKRFTDSLLNWKTSTGPNSAQLPFLYVITQTLETVNVDLELDYLHLLKTNFNNYTQSI